MYLHVKSLQKLIYVCFFYIKGKNYDDLRQQFETWTWLEGPTFIFETWVLDSRAWFINYKPKFFLRLYWLKWAWRPPLTLYGSIW